MPDNMNLILLANIIAFVGALGGFIYGAIRFFRPKESIYALMITLSCGVTVLTRLYQITRIVVIGDIVNRFNLGVIGIVGSLLFLFTANFGVIDKLGDDGKKDLRKYRLIPLAAPAAALISYMAFFLFTDQTTLVKVVSGSITFFAGIASYYNLKHLILPDVEFGIIGSMRQYNLLALLYEILCIAELIALTHGSEVGTLVICSLMGIVSPLIIVSVARGVKKWTA